MAYIPFSPEVGCKYNLIGPDNATIASFNDPTDANYCGLLTDVTGLDSPDVRESGDVLVQTDGGWHGNFYYGRRPITITGSVVNVPDITTRTQRLDLIRRASNAMRLDATLWWQPSAAGSIPMQTWVRLQQPMRVSGAWVKTFQLQLVSQFAPLFSAAQYSYGSNMVSNPSFETDTTGWGTTASFRVAAGAALSRVTSSAAQGAASLQIVTTATANQGVDFTGVQVTAGQTYTVSAYVKGNAGGEALKLIAGDATVGNNSVSITATTGWQQVSFQWTPTATGTTGVALQQTTATAKTFFLDGVMVTPGTTLQPYSDTLIAENHGSWASFPVVTIYGPSSGTITVTNTTTGQVFKFTSGMSLAAGASVQVDMLNHIAYSGATYYNQYIDFVNSNWPALITGSNTWTLSGAPAMSMVWRDQWV